MRLFYNLLGIFLSYKNYRYRLELYRRLLTHMKSYNTGFCLALDDIEPRGKFGWVDNLWRLPELYRQKPWKTYDGDSWFSVDSSGMAKRIQILEKLTK